MENTSQTQDFLKEISPKNREGKTWILAEKKHETIFRKKNTNIVNIL